MTDIKHSGNAANISGNTMNYREAKMTNDMKATRLLDQ